jgi:protein SCO1/2
MNPRVVMALLVVALAAFAAVLVTAPRVRTPVYAPSSTFEGATIPAGVRAPDFSLPDQDGRTLTMRSFRGSPVAVTFLYTHCEDSCPAEAQQIKGALDLIGHDVPAVAFSVDPENDTEASAQRFLNEARMTGRMEFVLGTRADLEPIWHGYAVRPQQRHTEHQARIVLVDGSGLQRVGFPGEQATPERLSHDLQLLEKEG